ncbi:MAG: pyridoxamine 5'-phosphate oxidase [Vicinamibacterales bacterium]
MSLADIRRDYEGQPLDEQHSDEDPFRQFNTWFEQVQRVEADPTAMALATATRDGRPSVRTVLLKGLDDRGFVFYTNYDSRKAREMAETGRASVLFYWPSVHRQVRAYGNVHKVSGAESDAYFASRPLESRLAAVVSRQSERIESRQVLEGLFEAAKRAHMDGAIPRPEFWGGYRLIPEELEFWQGRESRLHDRLRYVRQADGTWQRDRLAP